MRVRAGGLFGVQLCAPVLSLYGGCSCFDDAPPGFARREVTAAVQSQEIIRCCPLDNFVAHTYTYVQTIRVPPNAVTHWRLLIVEGGRRLQLVLLKKRVAVPTDIL